MAEHNSQIEHIAQIDTHLDYQAVIIGAGVAGIYQIKRLADLGVRATVLDANADLGGIGGKHRSQQPVDVKSKQERDRMNMSQIKGK